MDSFLLYSVEINNMEKCLFYILMTIEFNKYYNNKKFFQCPYQFLKFRFFLTAVSKDETVPLKQILVFSRLL